MLNRIRDTRYMQYIGALTATISNAGAAMYSVWASPALPILQSDESPLGRPLTDEEGSWVTSLNKLGTTFATIIGGWFVEKVGRKNALLVAGVLLFLPWFMVIFGKSLWILYVARFISGNATCIIVIACSIYIGEIAENDIRGKLGSSFIILKLVGSLLILCIGPYVSYTTLAIISSIVPFIFVAVFVFMPESPYYLVKVNKQEQAEKNLRMFSGQKADDKFITYRMSEINNVVTEDMQNKTTLWEFLTNPEYRNGLIIILGIKSLQQLSGEAAMDAYMQTIVGLSDSNISEETSSIIFGFVQLPAALTASLLVDKFGRKPLLLISAIGCAIALIAEGTFFFFQDQLEADVSSVAWVPTVGIAFFLVMNPLGVVTLPYVLLGELFPTNIKGIAVATATFYGSALAFIVQKYFKPLSNAWGIYSVFWIFAACCVLGAIFVYYMLPETKGKSFAEIQEILNDKKTKIDVENKDDPPKYSECI